MSILWWLVEHWWLALWLGLIGAAFALGGWRGALAAATLGLGWTVYKRGRRHGRDEATRRDRARRRQLRETYDEIDARPRDPGDAYRRLHDRSTGECPDLPPPPPAAVAALQGAGDAAVDAWAVALAAHYDKLDACLGR